ncbi:hypothetical protein DRO69_14355 [Candidatus Bathyarchaeota archaeon]|nr:MAG: hypothetical protein DRO69_14355 [Candidatus Bathyarchaeota archaeon]
MFGRFDSFSFDVENTQYDWPDYVHIDYGFPLVWTTHTLITITGPADTWKVDIISLIIDLTFWLGIMLIITSIMLYFFTENPQIDKITLVIINHLIL